MYLLTSYSHVLLIQINLKVLVFLSRHHPFGRHSSYVPAIVPRNRDRSRFWQYGGLYLVSISIGQIDLLSSFFPDTKSVGLA